MSIKGMIGLIFSGIIVIFIVQNSLSVDVHFLFWKASLSLSILIFLLVSTGLVAGWFLHYFATLAKEKKEMEKEEKRTKKAEAKKKKNPSKE